VMLVNILDLLEKFHQETGESTLDSMGNNPLGMRHVLDSRKD